MGGNTVLKSIRDIVADISGQFGHIRTKRHAIRLGQHLFPTKDAARQAVRAILHSAPLETPLPPDHAAVICAILEWHHEKDQKLAYGCRGFFVRVNPPALKPEDRGFWIITERPPPGAVPFSYIRCFAGPDPAHSAEWRQLNEAARQAIIPSQAAFKLRNLIPDTPCPRCGEALAGNHAQVDHLPPKFRDILREFCESLPQLPLRDEPTYGYRFADPRDEQAFIAFHDARAVREVVCARCNAAAERAA
jgi:hypothetical protein